MKGRSRSSSIRTKRSDKSARAEWSIGSTVGELRRLGTKRNVEGMARYGIRAEKVFGVSKPKLDALARKIGKNPRPGTGAMVHRDPGCDDSGGVDQRARQGYGFADWNCGCVILTIGTVATGRVATCLCSQGPPGRRRLRGQSGRMNFRSAGDSHWLRTWRIATNPRMTAKASNFLEGHRTRSR